MGSLCQYTIDHGYRRFYHETKIFKHEMRSNVLMFSLSDGIDLRVVKKCTDNGFLLFIAFRLYFSCCYVVITFLDHGYRPIRLQGSGKVISGRKPPGRKPLKKFGRRRLNKNFYLLFLFWRYFLVIIFINCPLFTRKSRSPKQLSKILPIFSCFGIVYVIFWISE